MKGGREEGREEGEKKDGCPGMDVNCPHLGHAQHSMSIMILIPHQERTAPPYPVGRIFQRGLRLLFLEKGGER